MEESEPVQEVANDEVIEASEVSQSNLSEGPNAEAAQDLTETEEQNTTETPNTTEVTQDERDSTKLEKIEEEHEDLLEENGEVKSVTKNSKISKSSESDLKAQTEEELEIEEEYEEEEQDENGETKIVIKKRIVKVPKASKTDTFESFIEKEEEYEEEEVDETGETKTVKKIRIVRVPKEEIAKETTESYEEIEEEYEEEEVNEDGELVTVTKKRVLKVLKEKHKESGETYLTREDGDEASSIKKYESSEEILEEEDELQDEEAEEEEEVEEEEAAVEEGEVPREEIKRERRKKKVRKERVGSDDEEEFKAEKTKKKRRKKKRKSTTDDETKPSGDSFESLKKEGEEESKSKEDLEEKTEEAEKSVVLSLSSGDIRLAEERAAIAQQFEVLVKLKTEHIFLKKKNFSLTNKLVQYFKKQKMDHVFTEVKEDPDLEQKYFKKLMQFHESNQQMVEEKQQINTDWESQRAINEELTESVKQGWQDLMSHKREVAARLIDSRTGRTIQHDKTVEDLLSREEGQQKQVCECRLVLIKLRRRIQAKREERQMDNMGMDFHLMDYEKLSSLKEYYMDKITERDIEIGEVSEKMAAMEENLSHVKEQLRMREEEMYLEQLRLQRISAELDRKRANLNKLKASRHQTEKNTAKAKQQSGLLAYPHLLKDYEEKTQQLKQLTTETDILKHTYRCNVIRTRKLRETILKKSAKYATPSSSTFSKFLATKTN